MTLCNHLLLLEASDMDLKRSSNLIKKISSVLGTTVEHLEIVVQRRTLHKKKIKKITNKPEYPLRETVIHLQTHCNTDCNGRSFLPHSHQHPQQPLRRKL